jgi:hypothetical protein
MVTAPRRPLRTQPANHADPHAADDLSHAPPIGRAARRLNPRTRCRSNDPALSPPKPIRNTPSVPTDAPSVARNGASGRRDTPSVARNRASARRNAPSAARDGASARRNAPSVARDGASARRNAPSAARDGASARRNAPSGGSGKASGAVSCRPDAPEPERDASSFTGRPLLPGLRSKGPVSDTVLEYATPPVVRPFPWRRCLLFLLVAGAAAAIFWWRVDWWTYVIEGNGKRWPKFGLPLRFQLAVSAVVGLFASATVFGIASLLRRSGPGRARIRGRENADKEPKTGHH